MRSLEWYEELFLEDDLAAEIMHLVTLTTVELCEVKVEQQRLANFIAATNVAMIVGYKRDVDWMEGAALDLLLFSRLQSYKNMRTFWSRFKKQYASLITATGLQVYHG